MFTDKEADRHYFSFAFPVAADIQPLLVKMGREFCVLGSEINGTLPVGAEPVLKWEKDGRIIRLWSPPGPEVPLEQKVKAEWHRITLLNRCYLLDEAPARL